VRQASLLDSPDTTRSGLKSALRRAEAAGVDRHAAGRELLVRARERLGAKAQDAKEAKERKDAEAKAAEATAAAAAAHAAEAAARAEAAEAEARPRAGRRGVREAALREECAAFAA